MDENAGNANEMGSGSIWEMEKEIRNGREGEER